MGALASSYQQCPPSSCPRQPCAGPHPENLSTFYRKSKNIYSNIYSYNYLVATIQQKERCKQQEMVATLLFTSWGLQWLGSRLGSDCLLLACWSAAAVESSLLSTAVESSKLLSTRGCAAVWDGVPEVPEFKLEDGKSPCKTSPGTDAGASSMCITHTCCAHDCHICSGNVW